MIRSAAIVLCAFLAHESAAQRPYLDMAPVRYSAGLTASGDAVTATVTVDRSVPLYFFLPNVGRNSHVDVLALGLGIRHTETEDRLRFRATALDLTINRPPGIGGFRLLSYDRIGTRDIVADWLGVHAGPDVRIRAGAVTIEPRLVASASLASRRVGRAYFPDLPEAARNGAIGAAGSVSANVSIVLGEKVRFEGSTGIERFSAGPRPEHRHVSATLHAQLSTHVELVATGGIERAVVRGTHADAKVGGVALRFTPGALAY